jgi:hypothetical protein
MSPGLLLRTEPYTWDRAVTERRDAVQTIGFLCKVHTGHKRSCLCRLYYGLHRWDFKSFGFLWSQETTSRLARARRGMHTFVMLFSDITI